MDFLSNLIKRPNSIMLPIPEADSFTTSLPSSETTSSLTQVSLTMDRCSIDTELENLFDSAVKDLNCLEEQHTLLIDDTEKEPEAVSPPSSPRETIEQLLSEINVNLDQVTAHEMEHLQAMSLELSPLAVKASARHSMEQQKTLAAMMCSSSQPGTPTLPAVNSDPYRQQDAEPGIIKFAGLPEFDETQIPDLVPLSAEMKAQLVENVIEPTAKNSDRDYNSDSDVFAECLSMNSAKMSAEQSELEAYSSALNEVLENQLVNVTATTLENTLSSEQNAAALIHNDNCEPMDVDEITETMEILKDVLSPEDQQFLQQQFQSVALQADRPNPKDLQLDKELETQLLGDEQKVIQQAEQKTHPSSQHQLDTAQPRQEIKKPLLDLQEDQLTFDNQQLEQNDELKVEQLLVKDELLIKQHEDQLLVQQLDNRPQLQNDDLKVEQKLLHNDEKESVQLPVKVLSSPTVSTFSNPIPTLEAKSPPIPTHRIKTAAELNEHVVIQQLNQPQEQIVGQLEVAVKGEPIVRNTNDMPEEQADLPISDMKPLQLHKIDSAPEVSSTPTSPTFPIKDPEIPCHFPRSPHAPPEYEEMPYLEQAVIEPSIEHNLHLSGAIAKSPLPVQVIVTQPSPEKPQQQEEQLLSKTISIDTDSPLNGTFEQAHAEVIANNPQGSRATFGVPLSEAESHQRRTFSINLQSEHLNEEDQGIKRSPSTVSVEKSQTRLTYILEQNASPAMEATDENITRNDFEPMDVDTSMRDEPAIVPQSLSPPIPTHVPKRHDTFEDVQYREQLGEKQSPPIPTLRTQDPKREMHSPPITTHKQTQELKRPSIHGDLYSVHPMPSSPNATTLLEEQKLSAKEQLSASDEKDDVFVEHFGAMSPISDDIFKAPQYSSSCFGKMTKGKSIESATSDSTKEQFYDAEFQDGASDNNIIFNSSDFDYLYTKGSNNAPIDRSSLLLKFDPLLGAPVPVYQSQHQQELTLLNILSNNNNLPRALSPTLEEHETSGSNQSFVIEPSAKTYTKAEGAGIQKDLQIKPPVDRSKKHAKMSVDVIDNDCNKTFDNSNLNSENKTHKYNNMDELEKKIKNEVTRSEDIEKKLKDAEQREEALVKRITDKDKTNTKLNGVIEAYEKAIAELIHDKEQLVQNHDREMQEVQTDRDSNYHHLTSLETTFSDLHVKYEKSKEMTSHLKQIEENLLDEKKKLQEKLRQQEQRYEQMKSHAMQQMEIANKKLATISKEHTDEVKKLKALLKKEEVSRISTAEQLQQKSRENADLLKICEELIYDKGQGGSS
ncbi:hypothetical protein KR044_012676 [Drosophila immigrans]|nr:hypothetical protein KR044_012676 [Drosophila immigrans]